MEKGRAKRSNASKEKTKRHIQIILAVIGIAIIAIGAFIGYSASIQDTVKEWDSKIYPGVSVQDIDLGGMTKEEAKNILNETFQESIGEKKLHITIEDKQFELIYSDIIPTYDIDSAVEEAYNVGKEHGNIIKYKMIKNINSNKNDIVLDFSYDEEKLKEYEKKIESDVMQSPKNATISINGSNISIIEESYGKSINLDNLHAKLKDAINGDINSTSSIEVELEKTKAKITKEDLSKINGVIGTFSSSYSTSAPGRSTNIEIATKAIDGTIIMPGEIFSFNEVVGERSAERGYKEAGTYVGNKVEPGIGGGICQVSTAIYRAAMRANLRSVERTNHSMAVGYSKPGLDATVAYGYIDYKFKNNYDFPIYIQGSTAGKVITYNIYGNSSGLEGKTYDMANEILETIQPEVKVILDNTLPEGQEVNEGGGMTGYRAKSYQITYENGIEVNRELISTDTYAKVDVVIKKGTQPIKQEPEINIEPSTEVPIDSSEDTEVEPVQGALENE